MSAADLAAVTFGDVYNDASDNSTTITSTPTDDEARLGLQRLNLLGSVKESPALKEDNKPTKIPMPKLEGNKRRRPLNLVELPIDVLKDIVREVTHTNDLTNLCLTCKCLHSLAVPQIYSRFDIVWPDAATTGERVGVDALTHGLATLTNVTKRGNDHARWVKKFSLGNGPTEWVNEYNINKEGGKMLGTLVNLAITRMECLETFSWDMPTGILRDVFMSLHDLNGILKNVHVRFHDNRDTTTPTSQDPSRRVESPTFKGFKGIRSLSVLDIDERQYLEEMSYAIENSVDKLKELKVGLADHMSGQRWIRDWEDLELTNANDVSPDRAVGGVLGILFSRIANLEESRRRRRSNKPEDTGALTTVTVNPAIGTAEAVVLASGATAVYVSPTDPPSTVGDGENSGATLEAPDQPVPDDETSSVVAVEVEDGTVSLDGSFVEVASPGVAPTLEASPPIPVAENKRMAKPYDSELNSNPSRQLKLDTLALERVPISVSILVNTKAIDWSHLSNLTIINCFNHDRLFKALRRKFLPCPTTASSASLHSAGKHGHLHSTGSSHRVRGIHQPAPDPSDYKIRLKKLHTDCVTPVLIAFIRDTLPPNSLEILFLQETTNDSTVTMDSIYKGAIKRHRGSLKKLLVNSKHHEETDGSKWTFKKEHLAFISSGKMPNLRELGMALEYKDWHYFLIRLPHMPQLRSLYLTHIRDTPHLSGFAPRELANQILNTVILRPEVELCYVGVLNKCFEILEGRSDDPDLPEPETHASVPGGVPPPIEQDSEDEEESDLDEDEDDEDDLADEEDAVDDSDSDGGYAEEEKQKTGIRLREILFYDDKVEVFRARNATL